MKLLVPFAFASILFLSACADQPKNASDAQAPVAATDASVHKHRCDSGETIAASYPSTDAANVQYKGTDYAMQIAVSASGARYVGGGFEWWTKGTGSGSEGTLFAHNPDGTPGAAIENCKEI